MAKQKSGRKLRRSGLNKSYYTQQFHVTERNKARRKNRRDRRKKLWAEKKPAPRIKGKARRRRRSMKWEALAASHGTQRQPPISLEGLAAHEVGQLMGGN